MVRFEKIIAAPLLDSLEEKIRDGATEAEIMRIRSELCKCTLTGQESKRLHALTGAGKEVQRIRETELHVVPVEPPKAKVSRPPKAQRKTLPRREHAAHAKTIAAPLDRSMIDMANYFMTKFLSALQTAQIEISERETEAITATAQQIIGYEREPKRQLRALETLMDAATTNAINAEAVWVFVELIRDEDLLTKKEISRAYLHTTEPVTKIRDEVLQRLLKDTASD